MSKTILIVDDEQGIREFLQYVLEPFEFECQFAENGLEAVEKTQVKTFDLIIMDVHMPKMTGTEALRKILERNPTQKVIMLSSVEGAEEMRRDTIICLNKPVELDVIEKTVKKLLSCS